MEEIYRNVCERLRSRVPGLKTVALECGQTEASSAAPAIELPAALVEVAYPTCVDVTGLTQQCRVTVAVRVAFRAWPEVTDAEENIGLTDQVYNALQGWTDDTLNCLSRESVVPQERHDGLKVYRVTFASAFEEDE